MRVFRKKQYKRVIIVSICFSLLCTVCLARIYSVQHNAAYLVADMQFTKAAILGETRGNIYDINMNPIVNQVRSDYIVSLLAADEVEGVAEISKGVFIVNKDNKIVSDSNFTESFQKIARYSDDNPCTHIIGYVDSQSNGVCGIEKAFDKILSDASGELLLEYCSDANGNALYGDGIKLISNNYDSPAGIRLTIDLNIQRIVENALSLSEIEKGAIVVLDSKTAEIRAIASIPAYDVNNLGEALNDENTPFLNRALSAYPVGSVFKPIVAGAALENQIDLSSDFECTGSVEIGANNFACFNHSAHGTMNLNKAIEKSCNTYFIAAGLDAGAEALVEAARLFGFGEKINLCSTLSSDAGYLPDASSLSADSDVANFSFGQGSLLATPLQLAAAYNVFANKGIYIEPVILKELIDENKNAYAYYRSEKSYSAISESTCSTVNACLYNNMLNGTGVSAAPDNTTSAGKTATAQTGRYDDNGNELLCTWFCGFFPFEDPLYTIVVFNEEGSAASSDCGPVFRECAEKIYGLYS